MNSAAIHIRSIGPDARVRDSELWRLASAIRLQVFVEEQKVPAELELVDEETATHYVLFSEGEAVACARWRSTPNGTKIERMAVLARQRGRGRGEQLLRRMLDDLAARPGSHPVVYLSSQAQAAPFYQRQGFRPAGEAFEEAGIPHVKMYRSLA